MWNFLSSTGFGGFASGALNLLGGIFGQRSTAAANSANLAQAQLNATGHYLPGLVANAKAAGLNPLAVLGMQTPASANIVGDTSLPNAMSNMGQNLSRAAQAYGDSVSKAAQLDNEYKQAQIDLVHSETAKNLAASRSVLATQPGSSRGMPLPVPDPRYEAEVKPSMQRWVGNEGIITTPSREFTGATFSIDPAGIMHALSAELGNVSQPNFLRPDVLRAITSTPYDPALFGGGM